MVDTPPCPPDLFQTYVGSPRQRRRRVPVDPAFQPVTIRMFQTFFSLQFPDRGSLPFVICLRMFGFLRSPRKRVTVFSYRFSTRHQSAANFSITFTVYFEFVGLPIFGAPPLPFDINLFAAGSTLEPRNPAPLSTQPIFLFIKRNCVQPRLAYSFSGPP